MSLKRILIVEDTEDNRQILRDLRDNGFRGHLSLELFNKEYWARSADENLKTAMDKIRATVRSALAYISVTIWSTVCWWYGRSTLQRVAMTSLVATNADSRRLRFSLVIALISTTTFGVAVVPMCWDPFGYVPGLTVGPGGGSLADRILDFENNTTSQMAVNRIPTLGWSPRDCTAGVGACP